MQKNLIFVEKDKIMSDVKGFIQTLFKSRTLVVPQNRAALFNDFLKEEQTIAAVILITENENRLMDKWKFRNRIADIVQQPLRILNATVGKPYEARLDFDKLGWKDIISFQVEGLEEVGLSYDEKTKQITGVPTQSGDVMFSFKFKLAGQPEEDAFNEKPIFLIINPDPRSLWKDIENDKNDPYWKEDNVTLFSSLGDRHILVSSKRGRAHANIGSYREDDFHFKHLEATGWNIVVVADGAGSAKISRKGSAIACYAVVDYFTEHFTAENLVEFDTLLHQHNANTGEETQKGLNKYVYNHLGKAALFAHKKLENFAKEKGVSLKDLNTTLVFTLFKKYDIGYALLSFGVGDCPMGFLNRDISDVTLLNWIDVGEFGGGTRFITMPEIFGNEKFATRFGFKLVDDFSYLILMSDGIYDPKFVVESALKDIKNWQALLDDLGGKNEDKVKVELAVNNSEIKTQFSAWMDFWSAGNHDDRTLAIVF